MSDPDSGALQRARSLVLRHGWNTTAYQILNPGIDLWFSREGDAVAGYVRHAGVWVVAGAPVCAPARLAGVTAELEGEAAAAGERVCYLGAEGRLDALYRDSPHHARLTVGAQPVWDPAQWAEAVEGHASMRAQLNRARNKRVEVESWPEERARDSVDLHRALETWLGSKGLPPLHFLVEPETLGRLWDRKVFVATREGRIVGFVVASPVPARNGWLIEQTVRTPEAPNGTTERMIDAAVRAVAEEGAEYVTLGVAPLSERAMRPPRGVPPWIAAALSWVRAHSRRFYHFEGLESYKAKFRPERWEPVFAISAEPRFSARTLYAIAGAYSGGAPLGTTARAISSALRQELRWLRERLRR